MLDPEMLRLLVFVFNIYKGLNVGRDCTAEAPGPQEWRVSDNQGIFYIKK